MKIAKNILIGILLVLVLSIHVMPLFYVSKGIELVKDIYIVVCKNFEGDFVQYFLTTAVLFSMINVLYITWLLIMCSLIIPMVYLRGDSIDWKKREIIKKETPKNEIVIFEEYEEEE